MTWTIWRYPYDFGNHHMFLLCFYYYICFYSFQIFREGPSVKDHKIGYQKPKSSAQKLSLFIFNRAENLDVYRTIAVLSIFLIQYRVDSDVGIGFEKHGGSWIQPFQAEAVRKNTQPNLVLGHGWTTLSDFENPGRALKRLRTLDNLGFVQLFRINLVNPNLWQCSGNRNT